MIVFNPFDPFAWMRALTPPAPMERQDPIPPGTPIAIEGKSHDSGIKMVIQDDADAVTLSGTADGPTWVGDDYYGYSVGRSVGFSLDVDKAPTRDIFGRETFREKNSRLFSVGTSKGQTAKQIAERLAEQVNDGDDFRAAVRFARDGRVTVQFTRR